MKRIDLVGYRESELKFRTCWYSVFAQSPPCGPDLPPIEYAWNRHGIHCSVHARHSTGT
jgi:transposase